jgi:hypothetical protein
MVHVFHLDVAMTIQICFNMCCKLQQSDGCCRGDGTLGQGKGRGRDKARRRTGARRGWRYDEERSVAWREKERGELDAGGATGIGIESQMVGCDHWRGI